MSWRDYFTIRMIIALTIITFAVASLSDDSNDGSSELHQSITTKSTREKNFGLDTKNPNPSDDDGNENDTEEVNEDGEGEQEEVDEYEEELRDIAESHEAMSRDDKNNSTGDINHAEISVFPGKISVDAKNFDSREKSVEESSDESMTSNEAISSEPEQDTEVKELLMFKHVGKYKSKRVPTVKKELSSQKEVQENGTQLNATMEIVNGLKRSENALARIPQVNNNVLDNDDIRDESQAEQRSLQEPSDIEYEYKDLDGASTRILRKLDKRRQSDMKGLESYPPSPPLYERDLSKQRKLWELEMDEYTFAESLMELLVKLAENPRHWERAHRLLKDVEDDLELNSALDSSKRDYHNVDGDMDNLSNDSSLMKESEVTRKKPKKKKKKKKKQRYQLLATSTVSAIPLTTVTPMTVPTEATTQTHWRLVANRLFGPSWSSQSNDRASSNIAKVHYAVSSKQLSPSTSNQRYDNSENIIGDTSATTDSNRKYPLPRKFHFGKITTHEKGSPLNQHDPIHLSSYESDPSDTSNSRVHGYDLSDETYQRSSNNGDRYDQYDQYVGARTRNFGDEYSDDYQEPVAYSPGDFPRHQGYYDKPWKFSKYDFSRTVNPYFNNDRTKWSPRYGSWQTFWQPFVDRENDNGSRMYGKLGSWPPEKSMRVPPWRSIDEIPRIMSYNRDVAVGNNKKNHSESNDSLKSAQEQNDNSEMPKITMKTWNSMTSDPATWPFKLSNVKPWPKDKNGKSYNPNADLVRKLGLDKQGRDAKKVTSEKSDNSPHDNESPNWNKDRKMWPSKISPKIQSVGAWIMPADQPTWRPYESKQRQSSQNGNTSRWPDKTMEDTWQGKLTDWNVEFGKQSSHTATWSPKWKQFSYHKVNASPITKPGAQLESTQRTRNAFIAVSAISPSKYPGNEWRKNDIEETSVDHSFNHIDADDPTTQLLHSHLEPQMHEWKKHTMMNNHAGTNETDPLEHQLETLRHNNLQKRRPTTAATYLLSMAVNSTTITEATITGENESTIRNAEQHLESRN